MVAALALGASVERRGGSSPFIRTIYGSSSVGRTLGLGPRGRRFEPCLPYQNEVVAQVVEREPEELRVGGSTPSNLTKNKKNAIIFGI